MSEATKEETTEDPTAPTAPSVELVEADRIQTEADEHRGGLVARMQKVSPAEWRLELQNRTDILATFRGACLSTTVPEDWTLFKGPEGDVVGVPRKSACVRMRKLMGIMPSNYRPKNAAGDAEPAVTFDDIAADDKKKTPARRVTIVTLIANGYCAVTGEYLEDVRHAVRSDESFTGRGTVQDLAQSCRTGLDNKITRILSDVVKVPEDVLKAHGVDTSRCYKGAGFGTSSERGARGVAEEGIEKKAGELGREVLSRVGGEKEAARKLLVDITKKRSDDPEKDFKGFDSVERLTKSWQLDAAWKKLKAHPMFGDDKTKAEAKTESKK